jgi:hypothetical protein
MSYRLNKTNGDLVVELADGQIDNTSTDVTLVGRNYRGFGELFNENFIKIIENFSNTAAPNAPLTGQLWYDTSEQRLKIYNGTEFRTAGSPIVSSSQPEMVQGDLWIDNLTRKLYFYDGNQDGEITLVGPAYDRQQGKTGLEVVSVIDDSARERVLLQFFIAGKLFAVTADDTFRLSGINKINGYPDDPNDNLIPKRQLFEPGFNLASTNYFYRGIASESRSLVDSNGNTKTTADFLPSNEDGETTGSIFIQNSRGLSVGIADTNYFSLKVIGTTTALENQQSETDIVLRTRTGNQFKNAFYIDGSEDKIGIYKNDPQYSLDVNGDFRVSSDAVINGNLTVNGDTSYFNVTQYRVEDKNIELGVLSDGTKTTDDQLDESGITIGSQDGDKKLYWHQSRNAWTSNLDFNLELNNEFRINGDSVLSRTELGPTVTSANGLSSIGTLTSLNVDSIALDGNTISTAGAGLTIDASGDITVSSSKITNLADPSNEQDAASKKYVDTEIDSLNVALILDVTGLSNPSLNNPYYDVIDILENISPASEKIDNVTARIHTVSYNNTPITGIDIASSMNKQFVTINNIEDPFDLEDDLTAESVVQDVNFSPATAIFSPIPTRQTMIFTVSGGAWSWQSTN